MLKIAKMHKIVMCQLSLVKWNHRVLPWCVVKMGRLVVDVKGEEISWVTHGTILRELSHGYLMGQFYVSRPLGPPWKTFTLAKLT